MTTLAEDFSPWWNLPKYKDHEIEAKKFGDLEIIAKHGSKSNWPGEEKVEYWVELENGVCVGFFHAKTPTGRYKKFADFPVVDPKG